MRFIKGLFSLVLLITMLPIGPSLSNANESPSYSLTISDAAAELNQELTVTAYANEAEDLFGYEFVTEYDTAKLQFVRYSAPENNGITLDPKITGNTIRFAHSKIGMTTPGGNGKVSMGTVTFKAVAQGVAKITLTQVIAVSSKNNEKDWSGAVDTSATVTQASSSSGSRSGRGSSGSVPAAEPVPESTPQPSANGGNHEGVWITGAVTTSATTPDGSPFLVVSVGNDLIDKALEQLKLKGGSANTIYIRGESGNEAPDGMQISLPGSSIRTAYQQSPGISFSLSLQGTSYELPVSILDVERWARELGVDVQAVTIRIVVRKLDTAETNQMKDHAQQAALNPLIRGVDFSIVAEGGGSTVTLHEFGANYVTRALEVPAVINSSKATGVMYNPATGQFTFVPTYFVSGNGTTTAWIKRTGNSVYTVIEPVSEKAFSDLEGHWAQRDIQQLLTKLLVNGRTETDFVPEGNITRAEFAALLSRGLGLAQSPEGSGSSRFSDVTSDAWYADVVGTAARAGLVQGNADGTFAPEANITREQMAVMLSRALTFAGKPGASDARFLTSFKDFGAISDWAQDGVSQVVGASVMNGPASAVLFKPSSPASRAEAAVVLKRLLQYVEFMN